MRKYEDVIVDCPACGEREHFAFHSKERWSQARLIKDDTGKYFHLNDVMCKRCGTIYKNPMLTSDSMLEFYNGHYADLYKEKWKAAISKTHINESVITTTYVLDWLKEINFPIKGMHVFEVGTGIGVLMKGFEGEGAIAHGIDLDSRSVDVSNKLFGFNFENVSLDKLDFKAHSGKYDLVVCNNTIEHFYNPTWALEMMQRLLKNSGHILLEIPDVEYPYPQLVIDGFLSSAHNFTITRAGVENLLHRAGLRIEKISNAGHKKCLLILAKPDVNMLNKPTVEVGIDTYYTRTRSFYDEVDRLIHKLNDTSTELLTPIYVNSIVDSLKKEFPRTYNTANVAFANTLLELGRPLEGLKFLTEYGPDQPEDTNQCFGSLIFVKSMCYRQIGDFVTAKKLLEECANYYPNIRKYNYVKDLEIDGLVSNTVFSNYLWWNAERILQEFG